MPLPLKSIINASSSADHLLCFFAGVSEGWVGILRFPPVPLDCGAAYGGTLAVLVVGDTTAAVYLGCCVADGDGSVESDARRRLEISTLPDLMVRAVVIDDPATAIESGVDLRILCFTGVLYFLLFISFLALRPGA